MEIREIKNRLNQDPERVCQHLLPTGKGDGKTWAVGSIHGEKGQSLRIPLRGDVAGQWKDFATDEKGDLIDLWMIVRNQSLPEALLDVKGWLGIQEPEFHPRKQKVYQRPSKPEAQKTDTVAAYLQDERRLTLQTIKAFGVESVRACQFKKQTSDGYYLPYIRDGELVHWKIIGLQRADGKKLITASKDTELCLFGWQALDPKTREVTICEGEIDAMTLHQMGIPALSVPNGANSTNWIENDFNHLQRFERINLCMDSDEAGQKSVMEIAQRLGLHRCHIVKLDFKDPNECLQVGLTPENLKACLEEAQPFTPAELKGAESYKDALLDRFLNPDKGQVGYTLPWQKTHQDLRLRQPEVSIWTGINGHGKSQMLGQVILDLMLQGVKVCIASMEIKPVELLWRLTRQATAMRNPSGEYIEVAADWYANKLWLFDVVGTAKTERILEVFAYARQRFGTTVFVIDSLMKCGIAEDDYRAQKAFIEELTDFKNIHDVHISLVAHARKRESEKEIAGKMDIKGTGAITDLVDTVFSTWRNKVKEDALQRNPDDEDELKKPDALLVCSKQRNGEWEGKVALWFDKDSFQFTETQQERPRRYVQYSKH